MTEEIVDAFCAECEDVTRHQVVGSDEGTARCTVCAAQQPMTIA